MRPSATSVCGLKGACRRRVWQGRGGATFGLLAVLLQKTSTAFSLLAVLVQMNKVLTPDAAEALASAQHQHTSAYVSTRQHASAYDILTPDAPEALASAVAAGAAAEGEVGAKRSDICEVMTSSSARAAAGAPKQSSADTTSLRTPSRRCRHRNPATCATCLNRALTEP